MLIGATSLDIAPGDSTQIDFEGFNGHMVVANGQHTVEVIFSINGEAFIKRFTAYYP